MVAFVAGQHQEMSRRLHDGRAGQLPGAVAHRRDDRHSLLEAPRGSGPVGEAQEISRHASPARGTNRRWPYTVEVELWMENIARQIDHGDARAVVGEHHRNARRRAYPAPDRGVLLHLAEGGHDEPRAAPGGLTIRGSGAPRRERDEPWRRERRGRIAPAHAQDQADALRPRGGDELLDLADQWPGAGDAHRKPRAPDGGACDPGRPPARREHGHLEAEAVDAAPEPPERRDQATGGAPRPPRRGP